MAEKTKKIDVHNKGLRDYHTPSGVVIPSGRTVELDEDEGKAMLAGYPRDLISPDTLRSASGNQSVAELRAENERLQGVVTDLETKLKASIEENVMLKAKGGIVSPPIVTGPISPPIAAASAQAAAQAGAK